jgi:CBS domain-containing protein
MPATMRPLTSLTAGDLMSRDVIQVPETMPLREAARLLLQHQISGAPVVDPNGACVGVLSLNDLVHWMEYKNGGSAAKHVALPLTCLFQRKHHEPNGEVRTLCTLPFEVCPLQRQERDAGGEERIYCSDPHSVLADWQMVEVEELPADEVKSLMTDDPVMVGPDTPVTKLARQMIDAHIHRIIVVDEERRPIGIVSGTDILARVARLEVDADEPM